MRFFGLLLVLQCVALQSIAQSPKSATDSLKFPLYDHNENFVEDGKSTGMDLKDPRNLQKKVEYDPKENKYYFVEKVGDQLCPYAHFPYPRRIS
jgi:hypothetical protein